MGEPATRFLVAAIKNYFPMYLKMFFMTDLTFFYAINFIIMIQICINLMDIIF